MTRITRIHRLIGTLVLASTVASGLALGGASTPASAADAACVSSTTFAPQPAGRVFDVPASIDATGSVESSRAFMQWLVTVPSGQAGQPTVVRLSRGGVYWFDYTIVLSKQSTGGIPGVMWSDLPTFKLENVTFDLNGARIEQRGTTPYSTVDATGATVVLDPRKRWGNPILFTGGASGVEVTGGELVGSDALGRTDWDRPDWSGITISGDTVDDRTDRVWVHDLTVRNVWGDFVYIAAAAKVLNGVVVENTTLRSSGRQGITINGGTNVSIRNNEITDAGRFVFDSEPTSTQGWSNVVIENNRGGAGSLGYFQFAGPTGTLAERLAIRNNSVVRGNFRIAVQGSQNIVRQCVAITGNHNDGSSMFTSNISWPQLIKVGAWSNVTVSGNAERIYPTKGIRAVNVDLATDVAVGSNCLRGATDDTCPTPDTTAPAVPVPSVSAVSAATVCLTWPAAIDNDMTAFYTVSRNGTVLGTVASTQYCEPAQAILPLTSYQYSVQAIDNSANISANGSVTVKTLADTQAPSVPTDVKAEILTAGSARISWTCSTDDVKGVKYSVLVGTTATSTGFCQTTLSLVPGSTQKVSVRAIDTTGNTSALSGAITVTMPLDTTAPSAVPSVTATAASTTSITVQWGTATDDVKVGGYFVFADGQTTPVANLGASVRQFTAKSLIAGSSHTYTVVAYDTSANRSVVSTVAAATTPLV